MWRLFSEKKDNPMKDIKIALIQTHWPGSREKIAASYRQLVREAAASGAQVVCLQEFSLSPYFASTIDPHNRRWAEPLQGGESERTFSDLARENGVFLIGSLYEKQNEYTFWDTATVHNPRGELHGFTRKVHIPSGQGYHEDHYFAGAGAFPLHDLDGVQFAAPTCYDQWFPELSRTYALAGAEVICYPTAIGSEPSNPEIDTQPAWQTVMRGQAIANGVFIAAANRTGVEGVTFYGSSFVCDPMGRILAQASRDRTEVIYADLRADVYHEWRRLFPLLEQRRPETYAALTRPKS
jgi:N-carbamoylputrescine amidase